jgi:hypothetical protein
VGLKCDGEVAGSNEDVGSRSGGMVTEKMNQEETCGDVSGRQGVHKGKGVWTVR